jgi:LysM repeat protein
MNANAKISIYRRFRWQPLAAGVVAVIALVVVFWGLSSSSHAQSPCGEAVTVMAGDSLYRIASRCNVTFSAILQANPEITNPNLIRVGQTIRIPQAQQPGNPAVNIAPDAGLPGSRINIAATGFPTNSEIIIGVGPEGQSINTVSVSTGAQGSAETVLTVPEVAEPGSQYEVIAFVTTTTGAVSASAPFTVTAGDEENGNEVTVVLSPTSGPPGTRVAVEATGLPANTTIDIGAGPVASEYDIIAQAQVDAQGILSRTVAIPNLAEPGEEWVIALTPEGSPADYISNPFTVTEQLENGETENLFTSTNIYLIALEDAGRSGVQVGCGDSVVPVQVEIEPTLAVLTAALETLVNLDERFYGESGLYNVLYRSDLNVEEVTIQDGEAIIQLSGEVMLGGVCDNPRFLAQLRQTALQYYTVDTVSIFVNGEPLEQVLQLGPGQNAPDSGNQPSDVVLPEPLLTQIQQALSEELGVDSSAVELVSVEEVEWPSADLGCPEPGQVYAQVVTPGYRVIVEANEEQYEYHTTLDESGPVVRCEG